MDLKDYQVRLLDAFEAFLVDVRDQKSPAKAFEISTRHHFGFALPYHPLVGAEGVPYVCLRVPTGGGKTRLAGHAIKRVNHAFLATTNSLVIWLVPSDPIREQTLYGLRTPGELLYEDMRASFGAVNVLEVDGALSATAALFDSATTIIVATMQSFKRDSPDGLRVNRQNGALMSHFEGLPSNMRGEQSLVDVIRLRRPFVIVDEAHSQGTALAVDTLTRFNPAAVLELTATPDRSSFPSNVLRSVSAATLQAEDMVKLPLEVGTHPEWRACMAEAIARIRALEKDAAAEAMLTGEVIDPVVMLIQAERRDANMETFTPARVKRHLVDDFNVPEHKIAIATGALDELAGRRLGDPGYPQFIITVDKLREGWDCPNAYVLFSFRNTTSATAVEQILGRVLRMPHVSRKKRESLNRSYAYVVSDRLADIVANLRDGLVQNGFERLDAQDLVSVIGKDQSKDDLFRRRADLVIPLPRHEGRIVIPRIGDLDRLPKIIRDKLEFSPEVGTLTVKGGATPEERKQIAESFQDGASVLRIRQQLDEASALLEKPDSESRTPSEVGEEAAIPLLGFAQNTFFDVFTETALLDADWELVDFDSTLTAGDFSHDVEAMRRARLSVSELEKVNCDFDDMLDSQLALLDVEGDWTVVDLVYWMDRNISFPYADQAQKVAWLNLAMSKLLSIRGFSIEELAYRKFRLRAALERKLAAGLVLAKQQVFKELLLDETRFTVGSEHVMLIKSGRYAYDFPYAGLIPLRRHFFPIIGNLKDAGEEMECAEFIANSMANVEWWVRNVEKKPTSFWLQTASDRYYPDFIVRLKSGITLAVEYKGSHLAGGPDSIEKRQIGELWARRSGGECKFVWLENRNWQPLRDAAL